MQAAMLDLDATSEPIDSKAITQADGTPEASVSAPSKLTPQALIGGITVSVDQIEPDPNQPRKTFDPGDLDRLARSMKQFGQLVPILVKNVFGTNTYIIIDGEQRWRAAKQAGFPTILDCKVESEFKVDPEGALERQLVTNALRVEIRPVEQAAAFDRLMKSQGLTQQQLADKLGIKHFKVSRALSLLDLTPEIQQAVDVGELPTTTAVEIAKVEDHTRQQELADRATTQELTRQEVAKEVRKIRRCSPGKAKNKRHGPVTSRGLKKMIRAVITSPRVKSLDRGVVCEVLIEVAAEFEQSPRGDEADPADATA